MGALLRLIYLVWLLGLVVLGLVATSQLLFASTGENRTARWVSQLTLATLWPLAVVTRAGRETLRARFRV
jgi:NRPS condensation-like uncharacterized protein